MKIEIKKSLFLLATIFLVSNCVHAQEGFSLDLKVIPQLTYLRNKNLRQFSDVVKRSERFTTALGVGVAYGLTRHTGVAADVLYSMQGQRVNFLKIYSPTNAFGATTKLNYLKVPVYFTYYTDPDKTVSFIAKIGPQISFIVSHKFLVPDPGVIYIDPPFPNEYRDITYGAAAGVGAQFNFHRRFYITSNLRSDYDFTNTDRGSVPTSHKSHNMTAGFELGLKYFLKQ